MEKRSWRDGVGALLVFFGMGLLFLTIAAGFVMPIYWFALPTGLALLAGGALWLLIKRRYRPSG